MCWLTHFVSRRVQACPVVSRRRRTAGQHVPIITAYNSLLDFLTDRTSSEVPCFGTRVSCSPSDTSTAAPSESRPCARVTRVQQQVSEVKEIMMDNIEKVLDRGEKIELLVDKTENLRFQAGPALDLPLWTLNSALKPP